MDSVREIIEALGIDKIGIIEQKAKMMRETYESPYVVQHYEAFKKRICDFYAHYYKWFYSADPRVLFRDKPRLWESFQDEAIAWAEKNLSSYEGGYIAAERNAIRGRNGGMVQVIDALVQAIQQNHTEGYIRSVLLKLEPSDYKTKLMFAQEYMDTYGKYLFPGEELLPYWLVAAHLEQVIQTHVAVINRLRPHVQ